MKFLKRSHKTVAGAAVIGLIAAGGAFAYWTFGGAGTGTATTAASLASQVVVSQTASTGALVPGGQVNLAGLLTNPNATDIKVGSLSAVIDTISGGATASDFSITNGPVAVNAVVKNGTPLAWSGLILKYANSAVNQDNGKSATVTIKYTLSPFSETPAVPAAATLVNGVLTVNYTHQPYVGVVTTLRIYLQDTTNSTTTNFLQSSVGTTAAFNFTGSTFTLSPGSTPFPAIVVARDYQVIGKSTTTGGFVLFTLPVTAT